MRFGTMGMGMGSTRKSGGGVQPRVWTISADADGSKYIGLKSAGGEQTLVASGGAEIMAEGGSWGTSVVLTSYTKIYFRGNGTGGTLTIPRPDYISYLHAYNTSDSISGDITGMALTYLHLAYTGSSITGSSITGDITGMALTYLYLIIYSYVVQGSREVITGTPAQIGSPLSTLRIAGSYAYPWALQQFGGTKQTWTSNTIVISINSNSSINPTPQVFNQWLLGLASVSNPGTATLSLKTVPSYDDLAAAGLVGEGSGYYAMTTTLGYTLALSR